MKWFLLLINVVLYKTLALESSAQMWIFFFQTTGVLWDKIMVKNFFFLLVI